MKGPLGPQSKWDRKGVREPAVCRGVLPLLEGLSQEEGSELRILSTTPTLLPSKNTYSISGYFIKFLTRSVAPHRAARCRAFHPSLFLRLQLAPASSNEEMTSREDLTTASISGVQSPCFNPSQLITIRKTGYFYLLALQSFYQGQPCILATSN